MNWLDKLERKFGKYAIHNLMYYIIILYILGLVIQMVNPSLIHNGWDLMLRQFCMDRSGES